MGNGSSSAGPPLSNSLFAAGAAEAQRRATSALKAQPHLQTLRNYANSPGGQQLLQGLAGAINPQPGAINPQPGAYEGGGGHGPRYPKKHGGFIGGAPLEGSTEDEIATKIAREIQSERRKQSQDLKEELVRKLARALNDKNLGFKIDDTASLEEVARQIRTVMPDPRKGKTFSADAEVQKQICVAIAKALNEQFPQTGSKEKLIDIKGTAPEICRAVSELIYSMSVGVNLEFMHVHAASERILRNIVVLKDMASQLYGSGIEKLREAADPEHVHESDPYLDAYERLMAELEQMIQRLEGVLHVTLGPAKIEIEAAMLENEDLYKNFLHKFTVGKEFGNNIARTLTGLGSLSTVAAVTSDALNAVGLTFDEYAQSPSWAALDELIHSKRLKIDPEKMGKFETAANTLRKTFEQEGLKDAMREQRNKIGGDDEKLSESELKERRRKLERKLILKQYLNRSKISYQKLLAAVKVLGPRLGKEIPVSDKLDALRDALSRLNDQAMPKLDLSLIGFYTSAAHRARREAFLAQLRLVRNAVDDLVASSMYSGHAGVLRPIQEAIDGIIETIAFYANIVSKKYGGADFSIADEDSIVALEDAADGRAVVAPDGETGELADDGAAVGAADGAADDAADDAYAPPPADDGTTEDEFFGGDAALDAAAIGDLEDAQQLSSSLDLRSAINDFLYFFFVAKVRENLKASAPELVRYGEKYEDVLGDAVAGRLAKIEAEKARLLSEEGPPDGTKLGEKPAVGKPTHAGGGAYAAGAVLDQSVKAWEEAKASITEEYNTKKDFYRLLQAIDLYMKAFAQGLASDPETIIDIKTSLDGVNMLAKWFTESTGDNLAEFFDMSQRFDPGPAGAPPPAAAVTADGPHYYEKVRATLNSGGHVGNGGTVPVAQAKAMRGKVGEALNNFQALKNLLNAFARLGSRFGGSDLEKQSFMTVSEMYRIMIKFLRVSAVTTGVLLAGNYNANRGTGNAIAQATNASDNMKQCYITPVVPDGVLVPDRWKLEHQFFQFIVKAIAAKVLVVIGVFDLFERPEPFEEISPTRSIIGGAAADAKVIPEATELYFRLPRLAEFYKGLIGASDWDDGTGERIAMIPEIDSVFGPLVAQIFVRVGDSSQSGGYSELECDGVIDAINQIYEHYRKEGDHAVKKAIEGFIMEINRRFGLIKGEDMKRVRDRMAETRFHAEAQLRPETTNFSILPGEEEMFLGDDAARRLAPADRYASVASGKKKDYEAAPGKFKLDEDPDVANSSWDLLKKFREKLDSMLRRFNSTSGSTSFRLLIQQARRDIDREPDATKRMELVYRLIQGSELVAGSDQGKSLMFHETVVTGLNTLTAIHDMVAAFRARVNAMDIVAAEKSANAFFDSLPVGVGAITRAELVAYLNAPAEARGVPDFDVASFLLSAAATADDITRMYPAQARAAANAKTGANIWAWIEGHVRAAGPDPTQVELAQRVVASRFMFDRHAVMRQMVLNLFELTGDFGELVNVRYPGSNTSKLHLDFSKLRDLIENLMADVRRYLDLFRGRMDAATIRRFEQSSDKGSLAWLEDNLMDKMVKGLTDEAGRQASGESFVDISNKVNAIMVSLTRSHENTLNLSDVGAGMPAAIIPSPGAKADQYGAVLSALVHWDPTDAAGLAAQAAVVLTNSPFNGMYTMSTDGLEFVQPGAKIIGIPVEGTAAAVAAAADADKVTTRRDTVLNRFTPSYASQALTNHRSMLVMFNQLLAMYLSQYYDGAAGKIYRGLIDSFANGSFSQSVMEQGFSQPDIYNGGGAFGRRGDPTARSVLMTSLALVLRKFIKAQTPQGVSVHLISSLAEIPLYIKENYRATLPVFEKMFAQLSAQGDLIKNLIQRVKVECGRADQMAAVGNAATATTVGIFAGALVVEGTTPRRWPERSLRTGVTLRPFGGVNENLHAPVAAALTDVINGITDGCFTLSKAAQAVVRELADEPMYLQTSESSIQEYRARHGKMPLMPLSLAMATLRNIPAGGTHAELMPWHGPGSQDFKLLYGLRGLLAKDPRTTLASMPGVKELLTGYNATASAKDRIEEKDYAEFVGRVSTAIRFLVDTRSYRSSLVASAGSFGQADLLGGVQDEALVYSRRAGVNATQVLEVVDSTFQEEKVAVIVQHLKAVGQSNALASGADAREQERIANLIDLNIPPINVHALMRSMALANVYNYGYTFEEMACRFYQKRRETVDAVDTAVAQAPEVSTRDFFLKMLISPFNPIHGTQYGLNMRGSTGSHFGRICRGDDGLALGRPKFISDQMFNKVLFGSVFPSQYDYDESGPGGGIARGRDGWGHPQAAAAGIDLIQKLDQLSPTTPAGVALRDAAVAIAALDAAALRQWVTQLDTALNTALAAIPGEPQAVTTARGNVNAAATAARANPRVGNMATDGHFLYYLVHADIPAAANAPTQVQFNGAAITPGMNTGAIDALLQAIAGGLTVASASGTANDVDYRVVELLMGGQVQAPALANADLIAQYLAPLAYNYLNTQLAPLRAAFNVYDQALQAAGLGQLRSTGARYPPPGRLIPAAGTDPANVQQEDTLTYIGEESGAPWTKVKRVHLTAQQVTDLQLIGKNRFDSVLMRELFLIVNVYRLMRGKLSYELTQQRSIIERGQALVSRDMTEYDVDPSLTTSERAADRQYFSERTTL